MRFSTKEEALKVAREIHEMKRWGEASECDVIAANRLEAACEEDGDFLEIQEEMIREAQEMSDSGYASNWEDRIACATLELFVSFEEKRERNARAARELSEWLNR